MSELENVLSSDISDIPLSPIAEEKSPEQAAIEQEAQAEVRDVASIPGWSRIRKQMEADAHSLRTHENTEFPLVYDGTTSDETVGRIVRNQLLMARWIEQYIERIDAAVEAIASETAEDTASDAKEGAIDE